MHGSDERFNPGEFLEYLRARWIVLVASCAVAVALALVISSLLPRRYTATSTILIQAAAGNDPRAVTAVSQVYLDSLRTYESFATSDTLFLQALDRLHMRDSRTKTPVEALKRSVLKVSKPASTSILEISATWNDPVKAHELAQYIAEQTVELGRSIDARSADDTLKMIRGQTQTALEGWNRVRQQRDEYTAANPVAAMEEEVTDGERFGSLLERDLELAKADFAETSALQGPGRPEVAAARARVDVFEQQRKELTERLAKVTAQLETRRSRRATLDNDAAAARTDYETLKMRMNEMEGSPQLRGAHLEIIDPGIVPQEASSPNTRLNVAAALFAAVIASFTFVVVRFSYTQMLRVSAERVYSLR